jgi:hypothetical protein
MFENLVDEVWEKSLKRAVEHCYRWEAKGFGA